ALNAVNDGTTAKYDAINQVRRRAGIADITAADNLSQQQFADVVLQERLHELCFEHLRRFDLIRFGKLKQYLADRAGIAIQDHHNL
ncbi:RagB/SusD family nutrient uptake outer membrane protein, partial [Escherichia coli]|uniref:RagB/SusD family nutrient uptake outer membrane protein n=1 Tax=Escherichia coli TaxID=562 RepID=UPI0028DEF22A